MNIDEMTPEEKSVALAKLCEWIRPAGDEFKPGVWVIDIPDSLLYRNYYWRSEPFGIDINFYDPANMALAWRVLNWAYLQHGMIEDSKYGRLAFGHVIASYFCDTCGARMLPPAEAQRLWLDKILHLALDAGLLPLQERAE